MSRSWSAGWTDRTTQPKRPNEQTWRLESLLEICEETFLRFQFRMGSTAQLAFVEDMVRLMTDGIPMSQALEFVRDVGNPMSRIIAKAMLRGLDEGSSIADVMQPLFKAETAGAIGAAQQSGDLAETGIAVVKRLKEQHDARQGAFAQLVRPVLYLVFAFALYIGFAIEIWPEFESVGDIEEWPQLALVTYGIGSFLADWWSVILTAAVVLVLSMRTIMRNWTGLGRSTLDRVWPFTLYRGLLAANVLDDMGTLLTAGQDARTALDTLSHGASRYARMYINRMRRNLDEGANLSEMLDVNFIAPRDIARLKMLANYRNLRQTMALTGANARHEILVRVHRVARIFDFVGLALVAGSFAALIGGVYLTATALADAAKL